MPEGTWAEEEVARLPHPMRMGARLVALSDSSLLVLTLEGPHLLDGVFRVDPWTGHVEPLQCPASGSFSAVPLPGDRLLVATPGASQALLWSPLTQQTEAVEGAIPHGPWVCHDIFEGAVTILANRDLSGSDAGFDYHDNDTSLAIFDPVQGRFVQPFRGVRGRDLRGFVVQSDSRALACGFGRTSPYCSLLSMDLEEVADPAFPSLPFPEWTNFIGTDSERALVLWGRRGRRHGFVRTRLATGELETVGSFADNRRTRLFFQAAAALCGGGTLVFCRAANGEHHLFHYAPPEPVSEVGRIHDANVSCAVQGADGSIYVAGAGRVHRLDHGLLARETAEWRTRPAPGAGQGWAPAGGEADPARRRTPECQSSPS